MFRKRNETEIDIYDKVYSEVDHTRGAILKNDFNYYFVTRDFDYEDKFIVVCESKIEIFNSSEMEGLLNREDMYFVKLVDVKDLEIIF